MSRVLNDARLCSLVCGLTTIRFAVWRSRESKLDRAARRAAKEQQASQRVAVKRGDEDRRAREAMRAEVQPAVAEFLERMGRAGNPGVETLPTAGNTPHNGAPLACWTVYLGPSQEVANLGVDGRWYSMSFSYDMPRELTGGTELPLVRDYPASSVIAALGRLLAEHGLA